MLKLGKEITGDVIEIMSGAVQFSNGIAHHLTPSIQQKEALCVSFDYYIDTEDAYGSPLSRYSLSQGWRSPWA
jgi:hypothetical protein